MNWSSETYRLEEIERKFRLPCVICLTEGFYSDTDAEGFSQGDIISIDSKLTLYKVAANFASNTKGGQLDPNDVELADKEILVPYNYKGKLKVIREVKDFNSVKELSEEFPRFAKVMQKMKVPTGRNEHVTIQKDTIIELDRIMPGHKTEHGEQPAKLVIQFQDWNGENQVAVPLNLKGKFKTEPDNNEYTIKDAIHRVLYPAMQPKFLFSQDWSDVRYELPQFIRFIDDEIKRVYTQDLLEGIENMTTITSETLRLNRLVIQKVLVGHYKPVDENRTSDSERFRQRTLAVLPLDKREVRAIEVHVLKGVTEDIYKEVFLVRNVSSSAEIVEGSLYIDFVTRPRMKITSNRDSEQKKEECPPPRPPKPRHFKSQQKEVMSNPNTRRKIESNEDERGYVKYNPAEGTKEDGRSVVPITKPPLPHTDPYGYEIPKTKSSFSKKMLLAHTDPDGYEIPKTKSSLSPVSTATLADVKFDSSRSLFLEKKTSGFFPRLKNKWRSYENVNDTTQLTPVKSNQHVTATMKHGKSGTTPIGTELYHPTVKVKPTKLDDVVSREDYDEVHEWEMLDSPIVCQRTSHILPIMGRIRDVNSEFKTSLVKLKPTAFVAPSNILQEKKSKEFKDLNNAELVLRLKLCGLNELARLCKKEHLNGAFFTDVSKDILSNDMNLTGIQLQKFLRVRDSNWVPT